MLDQKLIRENPTFVEDNLSLRGKVYNIAFIHTLTVERKEIEIEISSLQSESKKLSKVIGQEIRNSNDANSQEIDELKNKGNKYRIKVSEFEEKKRILDKQLQEEISKLPNFPSKEAPFGKNENNNIQIKEWGDPLKKDNLKSHWEIGENLNLFDSIKSTKIAKSRFITLTGSGARLERALVNFMLDVHSDNGYLELMPPALVNTESLQGSGQLPKFSNESFKCANDDLWLSPTAEVPLTAFHKNEIIDPKILPLKYVAYSPCFRREAGSYGAHVRGLNRLHQFDKVEIVRIENPNNSYKALDEMVDHIKGILEELELPFRILRLCGGDLGFTSCLTYDFEVYSAAQKKWLEVSSVSNFETFQSNRLKLRIESNGKKTLAHTLNGSSLALPRIVACILENFQGENSIQIPNVLIPYTGFDKI